jgi:hypothetical protein
VEVEIAVTAELAVGQSTVPSALVDEQALQLTILLAELKRRALVP